MKSLTSHFIVVTLLIYLSVKQASSLRCYECHNFPLEGGSSDDNDDSKCEKLNYSMTSMIKQCPESDAVDKYEQVCRTFTFKMHNSEITFIRRSCGKLHLENIKDFYGAKNDPRELTDGTPATSMICNTDLCNSAADTSPTKLIVFLTAMLSATCYKYFH